jgi:adenylate kinase
MIRELLNGAGIGQKFLFDGFPRTLVQARQLDELLRSMGGQLSDVILLECPDDAIVERLGGRRTCKKCGTVYHVVYNPTSVEGICDLDGGELEFRNDDHAETVQKRLNVYVSRTAPLISYYRNKGLIETVDASLRIDAVREAVLGKVGRP